MADDLVNDGQPDPTPSGDPSAAPKPDAPASSAQPDGAPKAGGDGWVPSYRLREVSERAEQVARSNAELQQRLEEQDRRMRQAFGIDQADPKREAIRKELLQYLPEYERVATLVEKLGDRDIGELVDRLAEGQQQAQVNIGHQLLDGLDKVMADAYGEKVPPFAKQAAYAAFSAWVGSDPLAAQRYQRHDLTLSADFWKQYSSGVLDPHRQHFTEQEARRRAAAARTPRGGSGYADIVPGKREKKVYKDLDEVTDAAFDSLRESRGG